MGAHVLPVSPPVSVSVLGEGGHGIPGLLIGVRWDDETDDTVAAVLTEHRGIEWVERTRVEAIRAS